MLNRDDYQVVSGVFTSNRDVEALMDSLHNQGLTDKDISVLMSEKTRDRAFGERKIGDRDRMRDERGNMAPEGISAGGIAGGLLGALLGGLSVAGTVLLPGIGLLVAGPLVGALAGAGIGGATGGLIGALMGAGVPEEEARHYETALKEEGNIIVVAHVPRGRAREIGDIFQRYGARQMRVQR